MPPLITREEALRLGELEDHAEIEALIERAWKARVERFDDSTDMCSLVNAKSGGCAEDCGFCAQSRFAEAETPLHAMMEPEQILEHARAAEAAGAHRFCMVTQGQGLSKRDFEKVLEGARLVAEHTNLKRCASIGHMSRRAREGAARRPASSACTTTSRRPSPTTPRSRRPSATRAGCARSTRSSEAGLETCVGGILNLGETREQRVEMAFELAEIDPTSVPINLLNPRPGTKFGDRDYMDPWEAVKWIAIFRLILPDALFRLCGGRVENIGELQRLAVKAGINGVMMGNFLTTLGNDARGGPRDVRGARPQRRAPARQRRQPAARTTARAGSRARRPTSSRSTSTRPTAVATGDRGAGCGTRRRSCASRASARSRRGPTGRPNTAHRDDRLGRQRRGDDRDRGTPGRAGASSGSPAALRLVSGPQGPRVVLDGKPVLLLCSNNYLGLADHPRVREAAAEAAMRWGVGAGASRLVSGTMTIHRRLEERLAAFERTPGVRCCSAPATSRTSASISALARARRGRLLRRAQPRLDRRRLPARRAPRRSSTTTATSSTSSGACARRTARGALIVTDGVFSMDGDVAPLEELVELARRYDVRRDGRRGARHRRDRARAAAARSPTPALEDEVDVIVGTLGKALGSYGAYVALRPARWRSYLVNARALVDLLDRAAAAARSPARWPRSSCCASEPRRVERLQANAARAARRAGARGLRGRAARRRRSSRWWSATPDATMRVCEAALERGVFAQAIRPPTVPAGHVAAAARGDGLAHAGRAARRRARARQRRARPACARGPRAAGHAPRSRAAPAHAARWRRRAPRSRRARRSTARRRRRCERAA